MWEFLSFMGLLVGVSRIRTTLYIGAHVAPPIYGNLDVSSLDECFP